MAGKCRAEVSNLPAMVVKTLASGRSGDPPVARATRSPWGTGPVSNKKSQNLTQTEQFCFMKVGLSWPGLARVGLGWAELAWACLAWPGLAWAGLSWVELVRAGLIWAELGWAGLACAGLRRPGLAWPQRSACAA